MTTEEQIRAALEKEFYHGRQGRLEGDLTDARTTRNASRYLHEEGIWFAPHQGKDFDSSTVSHAVRYSGDEGTIVKVKLDMKNPYAGDVDAIISGKINREWLEASGYDGFIDVLSGSGMAVALYPHQITELERIYLGGRADEKPEAQTAPVQEKENQVPKSGVRGGAKSASKEAGKPKSKETKPDMTLILANATLEEIQAKVPNLGEITVQARAIREKTGELITVPEKADVALKELDDSISLYKDLLECVGR
jgi:hypothetical protein